jgi:hypothetical protein
MVEAIEIWQKKSKEKEYLKDHENVINKLGVEDDD